MFVANGENLLSGLLTKSVSLHIFFPRVELRMFSVCKCVLAYRYAGKGYSLF